MGNDGGSIPDRRDLVKSKPKAEQADKANQTRARWFYCALSKRKLQDPIVSCALGKLYNKDSIIEYLLDKSAYGDGEKICGHIRSLKDVKKLNLTPNPARTPESADATSERAQFVCSLTQKEMNGHQPFVYIATCGCVFSQAGLKTVTGGATAKEKEAESEPNLDLCPQCATKYSPTDDVLLLNPGPDDESAMRSAMERRRLLEPAKKGKKRKQDKERERDEAEEQRPAKKKQQQQHEDSPRPSLNPSITAASRAIVSSLAMEEAKRKAGMSAAVKSLYESADKGNRKETFMTMGTFTRYA
ncbi:putative DUF602-domain-containing protein [Lyophyllum shimeji]|uniref:DUF602-domain-containing protein n=1 Tax=Lyophyllum shimeji TaxID=47721 RepID=A0A9P3PII8_LYOSH|nr:putative DUF602-domain-containing protein [Lyophyllum shimeji]